MKINISSIRETRGISLKFRDQQEIIIPDSFPGFKISNPVEVQGTITNTGEGFLVQAIMEFTYEADCGRCLEKFSSNQKIAVNEQFISGLKTEVDGTVYRFHGDYLDLTECLAEQALLSLPITFLCNPDCLGLCVECGKNLNSGKCQCLDPIPRLEFEKLRTLLSTEGGGANGKSKK